MVPKKNHQFSGGAFGAAITISVLPQASRNEIVKVLKDGTIQIRLTSLSGSEKLNQDLLNLLAKKLDIEPNQLEILAGRSGNDKLVSIMGLSATTVQERLVKGLGYQVI
jgi:uncharacterized protein YggU (UPF0235/DUF167 family)